MTSNVTTVSFARGTAPVGDTAVFEIYIKATRGADLGGHHRSGAAGGLQLRRRDALRLDDRLDLPRRRARGRATCRDGENLVVEPPHLLVQSFTALWSDEVEAQGSTRVTWEIEPVGDSCRLTVVHDQLPDSANAELYGGWPMILSGLKTLLETGERLTTPGSLMYAAPHPDLTRDAT